MNTMAQIKNVHELTDDEIEDCIDGSSDVKMIREILALGGIVDNEGWIDPDAFADSFARAIEGFISEDEESPEYEEAWDNNWNWGFDIADNINSYISDNFKGEE